MRLNYGEKSLGFGKWCSEYREKKYISSTILNSGLGAPVTKYGSTEKQAEVYQPVNFIYIREKMQVKSASQRDGLALPLIYQLLQRTRNL